MKEPEHIEGRDAERQRSIGNQDNSRLNASAPATEAPKFRAKLFFTAASTLFVVFLAVGLIVHKSFRNSETPAAKRVVSIQLEVLNGTTESKIAQRLTEVLRAGGFDVVDMGNYKSSAVEHTTVIARTANKAPAETVASFLGVDKSRVLQQPDKNLYLDVTIVIGKDIGTLRAFK
ncbi:MAG TPA: LytR C-terminal domain-containing protein [Bacteroidota bacterium]